MLSQRLGFFHPKLIPENKFGKGQNDAYIREAARKFCSGFELD